MKHSLLTLAALSIALTATAQTDTVKVARNVKQVLVTRNDLGFTSVNLIGTAKDDDYRYKYTAITNERDEESDSIAPRLPEIGSIKKSKTWKRLWLPGAYVGFIDVTSGNTFGLKTGHSFEVGVSWYGIKYRPWQSKSYFTATFDLISRQFSTAESDLSLQGNHPLTAVKTDENTHVKYNHITTGQISVPVMYHQNISKKFEIALGAAVNWNFYNSASTKYTKEGESLKYSETTKGLNQQPFTVDLLASIGWAGEIKAYVRYSPMSAYKAEYGPELKTLAFGLAIGF